MKSDKKILIAFLLNLFFGIFEFIGGIFTNSISIISDSIHDFADSISIGISYVLEKISKRKPNKKYTYGYLRYSVLGAFIINFVLIIGSIIVIINGIKRIINPVEISYSGMIIFALLGVIINFIAAYFTKEGDSLNQKSVNLHMLEDVLGWFIVLIGAIIMKFTNISIIDPIMSIGVSVFIFINAIKNLKEVIDIFLEKVPSYISIEEIKKRILRIKDIKDIHHIHIWSIDGNNNYATIHIVTDEKTKVLKQKIREIFEEFNINHVTIETEKEICNDYECSIKIKKCKHHH